MSLGDKVKKSVCAVVVAVGFSRLPSSEQVTFILNILGIKKHNLSKF